VGAELFPLASGSLGNALLVRTDRAAVLVDMGLTQRRLRAALAAAGHEPDRIRAILLTHTHRDHFSTAAVGWCVRHSVPVYSSRENLEDLVWRLPRASRLVREGLLRPMDGEALAFGDITVESFGVPHDSPGRCTGFRLALGPKRRRRVATVATDLGHVTAGCVRRFVDSHAVVIESNHDPEMLAASGRPWDLIERIAGPEGHLSNGDSAEAIAEIVGRSRRGRVRHVVLAHLSRDCNTPRLALAAQAYLAKRAGGVIRFAAADQFRPGPPAAL
jgi:phosphoribosyl 1,2-cyclic phosphodiesterase